MIKNFKNPERGDGSWTPVPACLPVPEFDRHGLASSTRLDTAMVA
jgi:hypothetical protein